MGDASGAVALAVLIFSIALCAPMCVCLARNREKINSLLNGEKRHDVSPTYVEVRERTKRPRDHINSENITKSNVAQALRVERKRQKTDVRRTVRQTQSKRATSTNNHHKVIHVAQIPVDSTPNPFRPGEAARNRQALT
jgi:hypothetical protein